MKLKGNFKISLLLFITTMVMSVFLSCSGSVDNSSGDQLATSDDVVVSENKESAPVGINIYFEKPSDWSEAWIWFDSGSDGSWDTTQLKQSPGDMVEYRTVDGAKWYKKELGEVGSVTFLFNGGDWGQKIADIVNNGNDFRTTCSIWVRADGSYTLTDPVATKPEIKISPESSEFYTDSFNVTINVESQSAFSECYFIINGERTDFSSTTLTIDIASEMEVGDVKILKVVATNNEGTTETDEYTFKKIEKPAGVTIYFEKPSSWNEAWIWYDKDSDNVWETSQLKQAPGDMVKYRSVNGLDWYKKVVVDTESVTFLFNSGDWSNKLADTENNNNDFVAAENIWVRADGKAYDHDPVVIKPEITVDPQNAKFTEDIFNVTITVACSSSYTAYYTIGGVRTDITANITTVNIADGMNVGDIKKLKVFAEASGVVVETPEYSYEKTKETEGIVICFQKPAGWDEAWIWFDKDSDDIWETTVLKETPGDMTRYRVVDGYEWFKKEISQTESVTFLFNKGDWSGKVSAASGDFVATKNVWVTENGVLTEYDPVDNEPPVVSMTYPTGGETLTGVVSVEVNATDNTGVDKLELYFDGKMVATASDDLSVIQWDSGNSQNKTAELKVRAYDKSGNNTYSVAIVVTTENANKPPIANAGGNRTVYKGKQVTFDGSGSYDPNGYIVSYTWDNGDDGSMSGERPVHTYDELGTYYVTLTVIDNDDASDTDTITVNVIDEPERTDFREETIYFVLPARFYDGDPANNVRCWDGDKANNPADDPAWRGDFKGLIDKLDYIKALGFSAIWITPPVKNASGYDYHGYHAVNFKEIDPRYKTTGDVSAEESYKKFIDAAHEKGIKIIQDIVFNHTSNFGEENLFPLFKKDPNKADIPENMIKIAPDGILPANYDDLDPTPQFDARIAAMKDENIDTNHIYHNEKSLSWESYTEQTGQIDGDCVDLNTENPIVANYLVDAYTKYINMGVDAFRIDTVKHVNRYTMNKYFLDQLNEAGGENFFMFGEVCNLYSIPWNTNIPSLSAPFYTWDETSPIPADGDDWFSRWNSIRIANEEATYNHYEANKNNVGDQPLSNNHALNGNEYHTPDYSKSSGMAVIDFAMHHNFQNAGSAYGLRGFDNTYNDATWNVTYVDSHDYGPNGVSLKQRFTGSQDTWAENLSLMFTFRGIPCVYYGSEIEFQKGHKIDVGTTGPLNNTGRAYYGDNIIGNVVATGFGVYSAEGKVKETLEHPLAQHIRRLNMIRHKIPALQKGQYSEENISTSGIAFKRRFTDPSTGIDSMALVAISAGATFSGVPNGKWVDVVTGDVQNGSTITASCSGKGNIRVYVLDQSGNPAPGIIGDAGTYIK